MIDNDIETSRRVSLNLNKSLTLLRSNLVAQQSTVNLTLSTLVTDFGDFSDSIRDYLSRPPDTLASITLPQSPRSRLAEILDDLERLAAEFRHELDGFASQERSAWKRLISNQLTRRFYERLRSDVASFSTHQLRELAASSSPGGDWRSITTSGDWNTNYELDDQSPDGVGSQLTSIEGRYALLNADIPTMDLSVTGDQVTRELTYFAQALDVHRAIGVKVKDVLARVDDLTSSIESLRADCGPQSEHDNDDLAR